MKPRYLLRTALLAVSIAGLARGQDAKPAPTPRSDEIIELPSFEIRSTADNQYVGKSSLTTTRVGVDLSELPQSVKVLNRSFLDAVGSLNLVDVLSYVGGAQTGHFNFTPGRVNMRGFSGDGDYNDGFAPSSANNLDGALYDRFEVVKGPSTIFLAADGSPGGIINKITKSPLSTRQTSITAQAGLFDANNASIDSTGPITSDKRLLYRAVFAQQYSEGEFSQSQMHRATFMPQLSYQLNATGKLEVKALFVNAIFPSYTSVPVDPRTLQTFDLPRTEAAAIDAPFQWYFHDKVKRVWGNYTQRLNDHIAFRVGAMTASDILPRVVLQTSVYNTTTHAFRVLNYNGTQAFPRSVVADTTDKRYDDLQADVNLNFNTGPLSHNLLVGGERAKNTTALVSWPGTTSNWNPYSSVTPITAVNYNTISAQTFGKNVTQRGFALETLKAFQDRLILSYGISQVEATTFTFNQLTNVYSTPEYSVKKTMKQYGAVVKVRSNISIFYGYNENFALNGTGILNGVSGPLPPKLGKQAEVGVKAEFFDRKLSVNIAYFDVKQLNNSLPSVPFDPLNPRVLIPGVISRGFDGDWSWEVNQNVYLMGSFAFFDAKSILGPAAATYNQPYYGRVVTDVIPVNNNAETSGSVFGLYKFTSGKLRGLDAGLGINYLSKRAITDSANQEMFGFVPSRTLVSLILGYRQNEHLRYSLHVDNLLDRDYIFGVRNMDQIVVGDPLNLKVSATYTF